MEYQQREVHLCLCAGTALVAESAKALTDVFKIADLRGTAFLSAPMDQGPDLAVTEARACRRG